jgi:hypothetical protein
MATAKEFILTALQVLNVVGEDSPITATASAKTLLVFNDMMSELDASGVPTGFTKITDIGQEVTIPAPMNAAIKNQLTVRMKPYYPQAILDPAFVKATSDSWDNLLIQVTKKTTLTMFPTDLQTEQTLTEQNDIIVVEDGT